jgi:peptidoglycan/LPS O-acetylase OafA/YrhL
MKSEYRNEIDGLRAISVVSVILFHAGFSWFSGGFVGVDIFFLISGYLIAGILLRERDQGGINLISFYERRARRILPALVVILTVTCVFAWIWMMPEELIKFGQSLVATNTFISNIYFTGQVSYFDQTNELKPLLHTWSLAVEEQYYLIFPLALAFISRWAKRYDVAIITVAFFTSLLLAEYLAIRSPTFNFFQLPTRAWELLMGVLLALGLARYPERSAKHAELLSLFGLTAIIGSIVLFEETTPMPGLVGLIPLGGAALVIAFASQATFAGRLLGARLPVAIGLVSYSAYLWHQPVFAFARIRFYWGIGPIGWVGLCILTFVLAWLSWRLVEVPARDRTKIKFKQLWPLLAITTIGLLSFGTWVVRNAGVPSRVPPRALSVEANARAAMQSNWRCEFDERKLFDERQVCTTTGKRGSVTVWGDSHAMALSSGLEKQLSEQGFGLKNYSTSSCPPLLDTEWASRTRPCAAEVNRMLGSILQDKEAKIVILAARWAFFTEGVRFDNLEGGIEMGEKDSPVFVSQFRHTTNPALAALNKTVDALLKGGKRVLLVYPIPEVGWNVPTVQSRRQFFNETGSSRIIATQTSVYYARNRRARTLLDAVATRHSSVVLADPAKVLCNTLMKDRCVAEIHGRALYFDDDHVNEEGSTMIAKQIVDKMIAASWISGTTLVASSK